MAKTSYSQEEREEYRQRKQAEFEERLKTLTKDWTEKPENIVEYMRFQSRFYTYSARNTMLIFQQNPYASFVGSFKKFKDMGYAVNKGEHGMSIYVPTPVEYYRTKEDKGWHRLSEAPPEIKRQAQAGMIDTRKQIYFKVGTVFDIAQTNCPREDYPKLLGLGYDDTQHAELYKVVCAYCAEVAGIQVREENYGSVTLRGQYNSRTNEITINALMGDTQKLSTVLHEMAHGLMQHTTDGEKSTAQREIEADMLSMLFLDQYGLEITDVRKSHFVDNFKAYQAEQQAEGKAVDFSALLEPIRAMFSVHEEHLKARLEAAGLMPVAAIDASMVSESELEKSAEPSSAPVIPEGTNPEPGSAAEQPMQDAFRPPIVSTGTGNAEPGSTPAAVEQRAGEARTSSNVRSNGKRIPDEIIEEIKSRVNITDVAAEYVKLHKQSGGYVACCPFHNEKTPSFTIYPKSNSFYCFGCNVGGDVIRFLEKIENISFAEAVKMLADRARIPISMEDIQVAQEEQGRRERTYACNLAAARYFYRELMIDTVKGEDAQDYLRITRGLSVEIIKKFGLGYAPDEHYGLVHALRAQGFTDQEIITANLAYGDPGRITDRFRDRIMFPIIDNTGRVIAFGGRAMKDGQPKYVNTTDTPVFQKGKQLFAMQLARKAHAETLILTEGYMDAIALQTAGFPSAIASLGTALTEQQCKQIERNASSVIICYDSDAAGQKATMRAIDMLREHAEGVTIKVAQIPDGKDPDEFLKLHPEDGTQRLTELFNGAPSDTNYRLNTAKAGLNLQVPDDAMQYMNRAVAVLATLKNPIEREVYSGEVAKATGISKESIDIQVKAQLNRKPQRTRTTVSEEKMSAEPVQRYHVVIRPNVTEESNYLASVDVTINEDVTIRNVQFVIDDDNNLNLLMPGYVQKESEKWISYVTLKGDAHAELTRFVYDNFDPEKTVEVTGGGAAIDVGNTTVTVRRVIKNGNVKAYVGIENDTMYLSGSRLIDGQHGLFLATPSSKPEGKNEYEKAYDFASKDFKNAAISSAIQSYNSLLEGREQEHTTTLKKNR